MTGPQIVSLRHGLCAMILTHSQVEAAQPPAPSGDGPSPRSQRRAPGRPGDPIPQPTITPRKAPAA